MKWLWEVIKIYVRRPVPVSQSFLDSDINGSLKVRNEQALRLSLSRMDTQTQLAFPGNNDRMTYSQ